MSVILSYYAGRGHRPRWMALGMYTVVLFCLLTALPHFLYGAGEDALSLTTEHRTDNENVSYDALLLQQSKALCHRKNATCETEAGNFSPQIILFVAQFISGIGGSLYYTLGVSYMDDNIKRSKTPALFSKYNTKIYKYLKTKLTFCTYYRFLVLYQNVRSCNWLRLSIDMS